jgi:hypothetical protein
MLAKDDRGHAQNIRQAGPDHIPGPLAGQNVIAAAVINSLLVGPAGTVRLLRQLGIQPGGPTDNATSYWAGIIGRTCCLALFDIALMAGLGALGGLLW